MDYNKIGREKIKKLVIRMISAYSGWLAESIKKKYSKFSVVVEEADGILFWVGISADLMLLPAAKHRQLKHEAEEIVRATACYRRKYLKIDFINPPLSFIIDN